MDHSDLVYNSEEYNRLREELIAATEMVLEAAAAEGVYAFILTSSSTAVMGRVVDGRVYNEKDWSDEQEGTSAYGMLKAAVERAAVQWHTKYTEKHGSPFRLCRICPPAILGPSNAPTINEFVRQFITSPLNDTLKWSSIPEMRFHACTLKDAAFAHVLAVENEGAIGRYCIGERAFTAMEWVRALHAALRHEPSVRRRISSTRPSLSAPTGRDLELAFRKNALWRTTSRGAAECGADSASGS